MSAVRFAPQCDWASLMVPTQPVWDTPREAWHDSYSSGIPPRVEFQPMRAEQLLLHAADTFPERIALRYFGTAWSYQKLLDQVQRVAAHLSANGIQAGDRVMMVLPNGPEFVALWFGLHWIGAQIVPANPLLSASELAVLAKKCQVKAVAGIDVRLKNVVEMTHLADVPLLIVASLSPHLPWYLRLPYHLQRLRQGRCRVAAGTRVMKFSKFDQGGIRIENPLLRDVDLPAVLQPTGGTTGTPKVAVLTHRNLCSNVAQLHVWSGLKPGVETFLSVLPFFHIYGATCALLSPLAGGSTLLLQARFDAPRTLAVLEKWKVTTALLVPFMMASLSEEMRRRNVRLKHLKICMSGASALSSEAARDFMDLTGATIVEGFGLSEASPVTHSNPMDGSGRIGSIGLPLPNTEVRVVDLETGRHDVATGEVGEMIVRGPQIMRGYLDDPAETAIALRDGWLFTGDLVRTDAAGFFQVVDRKKDMLKSGGLNVYPSEVEHVILQHPAVARCAVVGEPDPKYGEVVVAWVVVKSNAKLSTEELRDFCRHELASYKLPRIVRVCESLPENFLGKIRRVELRGRAA